VQAELYIKYPSLGSKFEKIKTKKSNFNNKCIPCLFTSLFVPLNNNQKKEEYGNSTHFIQIHGKMGMLTNETHLSAENGGKAKGISKQRYK